MVDQPASTALTFKPPKSVSIALSKHDTESSTTPVSNQQNHHEDDLGAHTLAENADSVPWPTNRCCYEELKPAELSTIEHLFVSRDDAPCFMKWVVLHKPPRSFQKRLLVISSFRMWLLKRGHQLVFTNNLVVSREYQILHLDAIHVLQLSTLQPADLMTIPTSTKLSFHIPRGRHHRHHELGENGSSEIAMETIIGSSSSNQSSDNYYRHEEIHFDAGIHAEHIVRLLQRKLHSIRLVFPGQQLPRLTLPPQCHWHEFFTLREQPRTSATHEASGSRRQVELGDAMVVAYRCLCDDLSIPYRASVAIRLRECLDTASVDFQYCLSTTSPSSLLVGPVIPSRNYGSRGGGIAASMISSLARLIGLSGFSSSATLAREVQALARTLEHCDGFEDIVVYDFPMNDKAMSSLFLTLLSPPQSVSTGVGVKGFTLTNVALSTRALRTLQHIVLQSTIKRSTPSCPTSSSLQLRRLDLSFNPFSVMMAHVLATILELLPYGLEVLQLEQCHLSMLSSARILAAMKASHGFSSSLRELNLSGNTLGIEGTRVLAMWITGAFALHRLDLSRTRLQTNVFFQSFKQNTILHESSLTTLDLSYNRMGTQASFDLGDILGKSQSLSTLVLRGMKQALAHPKRIAHDLLFARSRRQKVKQKKAISCAQVTTNGLRKIHLKNILGPMLQNSSRMFPCMVDLSENNLQGAKATLLAHLIDSAPNATHASLRLDYAKLTDKAAVLLLHSLRGCKTLESLSLEGNGFMKRETKLSYKHFHASSASPRAKQQAAGGPTALERAAGDALSLLLGGKTTQATGTDNNSSEAGSSESHGSAHSFTHLYHHRPKKVPLRELSLRASSGDVVFGSFILTTAVQALALNTTLQMLDVSGNEAGDALARALGAVLPVNKSLHVLYWDDNFTTVDGFFAFYDGLLRNQTLSVVQLPIHDTRRILEEQKDPPREKLFSVLGKIFKVTERNQTMAQAAKDNHGKSTPEAKSPGAKKKTKQTKSAKSIPSGSTNSTTGPESGNDKQQNPEALLTEEETKGSDNANTNDVEIHVPMSESVSSYYGTSSSRYPTTIRCWARNGPVDSSGSGGGDNDDALRASWDQIGALASMLT